MFLSFFAFIAVIGIFVVFKDGGAGKFEANFSEGKISFSRDQPIVTQVKQPTTSYNTPKGTVEFTTGEIDASFLKQLKIDGKPILPSEFVGKNFINEEAGFLLTVENPEFWEVAYDAVGMTNPITPVNTIYTEDGSHLNINIEELAFEINIETYVANLLQLMINAGMLFQMPEVSYDLPSQTAFLSYFNPLSSGETYQKVIIKDRVCYAVTANYNVQLSDPQSVEELIEMVASFTLIEDVGY